MNLILDTAIFAGGFVVGGVFHGSFVDLGGYLREKVRSIFGSPPPPMDGGA